MSRGILKPHYIGAHESLFSEDFEITTNNNHTDKEKHPVLKDVAVQKPQIDFVLSENIRRYKAEKEADNKENRAKNSLLAKMPDAVYFILAMLLLLPTAGMGTALVIWVFIKYKREVVGGYLPLAKGEQTDSEDYDDIRAMGPICGYATGFGGPMKNDCSYSYSYSY